MSDTSEIFRKMADCPEIQDEWGKRRYLIRIGDLYYDPIEKGICRVSPFQAHDWNAIPKGAIYLPRQDQLQGMLGYNLKHPDALSILIGNFWFFNQPVEFAVEYLNDNWQAHETYLKQFTSMEQLWLAFVMHELHQKRWINEKWVKS